MPTIRIDLTADQAEAMEAAIKAGEANFVNAAEWAKAIVLGTANDAIARRRERVVKALGIATLADLTDDEIAGLQLTRAGNSR